ncbi:hypothetical protein CCACVL1_27272 [Corchorus capsularis]|uniref:AAA-type ATPase N-terminal domain-containing protein n=1 Tax=Corchorus capsularis TaxID=210143 RepID=A0A1R3GBC9_COCAP|nr:hypothetical protein CCACVL1_27272 [Corchorus capsularis]
MMLGGYGDQIIGLLVICSTIQRLVPVWLEKWIGKLIKRLKKFFNPRATIVFNEFTTGLYKRSYAFTAIESYLSSKSASEANIKSEQKVMRKGSLWFTARIMTRLSEMSLKG